jgi:hypothetical protein
MSTERKPIRTRIRADAMKTIERLAEERRTTLAQVARVMLEDAVAALEVGTRQRRTVTNQAAQK